MLPPLALSRQVLFTAIPRFQIILIDAFTLHIGLEVVQSLTLYKLALLPASALIFVPELGTHGAVG